MSFGKLYATTDNPRSLAIRAVAKANGLDLELVETVPAQGVSDDYRKLNKLGKIPTFEGADKYVLSEAIAIAVYVTSQNEKTTLLGKTKQDYASILRWLSFANSELLPAIGGWFRPLVGRDPYNKKSVDDSAKATAANLKVLEDHLMINTYLVGERLTLADLFSVGVLSRGFQYFFDKEWRAEHPSVTRWYETVYNQPIYLDIVGELKFIDKAIPNTPPKKEKEVKKQETKPQAKAAPAQEEEDEKPVPKPKHPLEALGKSEFVLDDWKRKYSNEETREVALPWFWQNCNFNEYSIWRMDYLYPDELSSMTFMNSNLVGGFFTRLEASRKYIFGAGGVFKSEDGKHTIRGAFLTRGDEAAPAFDVAPDYESYKFTKLDPKNDADKAFVEDMWSWDKPIDVDGTTYEFADGKVFK
ncbi:eEF1-gamma domain-containing protein [Polychaeton citri CBS 116435]|uniref:EEF1-gamma domain-containing protein n=1 Tax=Polychaeton citri CBS 116435 TaxID=1314669 RepID=A0A9P4QJS0_9PEZI|nr:eEF1-gamma domain-containing protein [Polychaeton citri CBS 116435]